MLHPWIVPFVGSILAVSSLGGPLVQEPLWIDGYLDRAPAGVEVVQTVELVRSEVRRSLAIVVIDGLGSPRLRLAEDVRDGAEIGLVGEPDVLDRLFQAPRGAKVEFRTKRAGPARTFHVDEVTVTVPEGAVSPGS